LKKGIKYPGKSILNLCKAGRHLRKSLRFLAPASEKLLQLFQSKIFWERKLNGYYVKSRLKFVKGEMGDSLEREITSSEPSSFSHLFINKKNLSL